MKLEFKDIINKEYGKNAIIVGLGASLGSHINKINSLSYDEYVIIGCNDIDVLVPSINPHYWVWANSEDTIKKTHGRLKTKKAVVVYADSVDLTPRDIVDSILSPLNYLPYDQRHFGGNRCGGKHCCDRMIPGRLTIQEELMKYTGYHKHPTESGTVAVQMVPLAILLSCKNIWCCGIDLDYSKGYVNGQYAEKARANNSNHESFTANLKSILATFQIINDSAKNIGVNIYCSDDGLPINTILEYKPLP